MAFARDVMRAETIKKRALQRKRNAQAQAEEEARQAALSGKKMMPGPAENKALEAPAGSGVTIATVDMDATPEPTLPEEVEEVLEEITPVPLTSVSFASPKALEIAAEAGLLPEDFTGVEASNAKGYTAGDVRSLLKGKANG